MEERLNNTMADHARVQSELKAVQESASHSAQHLQEGENKFMAAQADLLRERSLCAHPPPTPRTRTVS